VHIEDQPVRKLPQTLAFAPLTTVYEIVSETPRKQTITYNKGVQTSGTWADDFSRDDQALDVPYTRERDETRADRLRDQLRREIEQEILIAQSAQLAKDEEARHSAARAAQSFNDQQATEVLFSNEFADFLDRSSKVAERALEEDYDVLADYRITQKFDLDQDTLGLGKTGHGIRELAQYYDDRWSKKRMITDLDFSPKVSPSRTYFDVKHSLQDSFLSLCSHPTRKVRQLPTIQMACSWSGTSICHRDQNTGFKQIPTFSQHDSRRFIPISFLAAPTLARFCFGTLDHARQQLFSRLRLLCSILTPPTHPTHLERQDIPHQSTLSTLLAPKLLIAFSPPRLTAHSARGHQIC
jgi:hypothetical protein